MNLESFSSILWGFSRNNLNMSGRGINDIKFRFTFTKHLLFSLLKGRPVVVYALPTSESVVRKIVTACSLFVPGHWFKHSSTVAWQTKPLKMSDLACSKLIGLSKQQMIPKAVEKYVSIFDYESETLTAPPYSPEAKFIEDLLNPKKQWPDEDTYLAFVHFILYDLCTKACLFYHLCCVGVPQTTSNQSGSSNSSNNNNTQAVNESNIENKLLNSKNADNLKYGSLQYGKSSKVESKRSLSDSHLSLKNISVPAVREQSKVSFFKKLGLQKNDIEIIEHLAEIVKEQQSLEIHGVDQVSPVIRLDYSPCQILKNIKK